MVLDRIDLQILNELQANARISIAELAKRVALTPTPCARRVQQLEAAGFIRAYATCSIRPPSACPSTRSSKCGSYASAKPRLRSSNRPSTGTPEVMECWAMSGGYDYLLRVVTSDLDGYNTFLRNQLLNLGCVDHVETGFALQRVVDRTTLPLKHLSVRR